jgi:predicted metal-dependent hydrolase
MSLNWNNGALADGLRCFSHQEFFAAHEHWEAVWLQSEEPQKSFLQALIQVASAFHHHQRNNFSGTASLLRRAQQKLDSFPAFFEQVDVAGLRSSIADWLCALESSSSKVFPTYSRINIADCGNETQNAD